jgi:WD40 repeat protein
LLTCLYRPSIGAVLTVRWAHHGRYLASGSDDGIVLIWNLDPYVFLLTYLRVLRSNVSARVLVTGLEEGKSLAQTMSMLKIGSL